MRCNDKSAFHCFIGMIDDIVKGSDGNYIDVYTHCDGMGRYINNNVPYTEDPVIMYSPVKLFPRMHCLWPLTLFWDVYICKTAKLTVSIKQSKFKLFGPPFILHIFRVQQRCQVIMFFYFRYSTCWSRITIWCAYINNNQYYMQSGYLQQPGRFEFIAECNTIPFHKYE